MSTVCVGLFLLDRKFCIDELIFHYTTGMQLNESLTFELCIWSSSSWNYDSLWFWRMCS